MIRLPAIQAHSLWAPSYDSSPNPLLALERRALTTFLAGLNPRTVIDVACGTGRWLEHFQHCGSSVFGLDACEPMLERARERRGLSGTLVQGDAGSLPFGTSSADLVLCSMSLGYFNDLNIAFEEFARVSRPCGAVAITDIHPDAIAAGWTRSFTSGDLRCEIEHFRYPVNAIRDAASRAGLHLRAHTDAHFGSAELPIFNKAGKPKLFERVTATPALFLGFWER